ncbi:DUF3617 domain-containing protein [Aurantiacibacter marinus]|nr:DUF3617 family protein [Aurantiacibacter marinus]
MRPIFALPLIAAFALTACGNDADQGLTDEELAAGDVAAVIEDNGAKPQAGEYSTTVELIEFDAPGLAESAIADARAEFAAGAAEPNLYCVGEDTTREQWFSEMVEASCTLSRFTADGNDLDGAMTCNSDIGLDGRVEMAGRTAEEGSDLTMTYTLPLESGDSTVRMRVVSERIGDCG